MSKDILDTPTPIRFEDEEVWGVQKYDAYLSQKYGDYMTIPKQSGQRQHNFHYLDLNKPFGILKSNYNHIKVRVKNFLHNSGIHELGPFPCLYGSR